MVLVQTAQPLHLTVLFLVVASPLVGQSEKSDRGESAATSMRSAETGAAGVVLVKGQVTDSMGAGMSQVRIVLRGGKTSEDAGEVVGETESDEWGDFVLRGKEGLTGTFVLSLTKEHYAPRTRELALQADRPPPFVAESLEGNLTLRGRVSDAREDRPVAHAMVQVSTSYREWNVETDDEGWFHVPALPPGSAQVTVDASGFARRKESVTLGADAPELSIPLRPQRTVSLRIRDESGAALSGVEVETAEPVENDVRSAVSDASGVVNLTGLSGEAPTIFVKLRHSGYLSSESFDRIVQLPTDSMNSAHDLTMIRAARVSGTVRTASGGAVAGARVSAGKDGSLRSPRAWTDAEGRFLIDGLNTGPVVLTVHRGDFAPELRIVEARKGEEVTTEFTLAPGRTVRGVVKDERNSPLADMEVVTTNWRGYMTLGLRARTDKDGRFEIHDAPLDEFQISAHAPPSSPVIRTVGAGEDDVVLTLPYVPEYDKHEGGVHIEEGAPAPPVTLRTADGEVLELRQLKGKTVLFIFWVSWCPYCKEEIPKLNALYERYRNRTDFVMIGVNHDEKEEPFKAFVNEHGMMWKQVHGQENGAILLGKEFGAFAYPTGYIVGKDGTMAGTFLTGPRIEEKLSEAIRQRKAVRIEPSRQAP